MCKEQLRLGDFRSVSEEQYSDEIPVGYKKTEIGLIPKDWEITRLRDCLVRQPEYGINAPAVSYSETLPTYIRITDITDEGRFSSDNIASVAIDNYHKFLLTDGDIVFARTGASVGKYYRYRSSDGALVFAGFLIRVHPDKSKLLPQFLEAYLGTTAYHNWVRLVSTRSGQPGINGKEYSILPIPVPSIAEQAPIAEIVSDVDNLIESLDNLISKKQAIKKATMQQLLTGRTRLPGFNGGWKKSNLGKIGKFLKGNGIKRDELVDSGYPCILYGELYTTYKNYILNTISRIPYCITNVALPIETGDLLFTGSGETPEEIGKCSAYIGKERVYAGGDIVVLRSPKHDSVFLSHLMNHSSTVKQKSRLAQGDAVVHISARHLSQIEICLPPIEEQRAISSILIDMDAEIDALERQRGKMKQIKQGMLQQLLTGRIRLLDKEAV